MSRTSSDDFDATGVIRNGFDYELQVWVKQYIILGCGHPASMRPKGESCCNQHKHAGKDIRTVEGHEGIKGIKIV